MFSQKFMLFLRQPPLNLNYHQNYEPSRVKLIIIKHRMTI